jgi:L-cysteine desulfidase
LINYCLNFFTGILCDGAKISCAWKVEAALSVGFKALELVESKRKINSDGINNIDAFKTIKLIGNLSKTIMTSINDKIVDIIDYNLDSRS